MQTVKVISFFFLIFFVSPFSYGQSTMDRNFSNILQSYYLYKDKDLVDKTIDFVNHSPMSYERLEPILIGFFGALFSSDEDVKKTFESNFDKIEKPDVKELMMLLGSINIDTVYSRIEITSAYNDMNWSSFFATGNVKYIDNVIAVAPYEDERTNMDLFLAGSTAKWSLCANASQDKHIKKYLNSIKDKNEILQEVLQKDHQYYKDKMAEILKEQKSKGIWH